MREGENYTAASARTAAHFPAGKIIQAAALERRSLR